MIISVHIRKAAGSSFRAALKEYYKDRVYMDYGDEIGSSTLSSKFRRLKSRVKLYKEKRYFVSNYEIIHGHFYADKYKMLPTDLKYATVLRNPIDRVISNYNYLVRNPRHSHPNVKLVHENTLSLIDYIRHPETQNIQTLFLNGMNLADFTFVGLSEKFEQSVMLFNKMFGAKLRYDFSENTNPDGNSRYEPEPVIVELIRHYNAEDFKLYDQAVSFFDRHLQSYCPDSYIQL